MDGFGQMTTLMAASSATLAFAASDARADSKIAETFDPGPAIQGNSDPAMPIHQKAKTHGMHEKAM